MNLTGHKDTDKLVFEKLSDRELLSLMQTNKEYLKLGQDFFQRRMKKNYPILAEKKPSDISWFKYYVNTIYYISKLKEDYKLDYYNTSSYDPREIFSSLQYSTIPETYKIRFLVEMGEVEKAKDILRDLLKGNYMFENKRHLINVFLSAIVKKGDIALFENIVKEFNFAINIGDITELIEAAGESGNLDILDYLVTKYNIDDFTVFYYGIKGALKKGNLKLINFLKEKYPNETYPHMYEGAAEGKDLTIFANYLKDSFKTSPKETLKMLKSLILYFVDYGKLDFLKYSVGMYNLYGGNMKELIKGIFAYSSFIHPNINKYMIKLKRIYDIL